MGYTPMLELDRLIRLCPDRDEPIDPLFPETLLLRKPESPRERIRALRLRGVAPDDIARMVGKTPSTVRGHLVRLGLAKRRVRHADH